MIAVVCYLIALGADLNLTDKTGITAADHAIQSNNLAIANALKAAGAKLASEKNWPDTTRQLFSHAIKGNLSGVKNCIASGISIDARDGDGRRVIQTCCFYN